MTWTDKPTPVDEALAVMKKSIEVSGGSVAWNGGEFYGPPEHNSLHLLKAYFTKYPEDASKVVLCIKGGVNVQKLIPDASYEFLTASVDKCNDILGGVKKIDQFEPARRDPNHTPTQIIQNLARIEKEGKIGGISLSEVGEKTIREAAKAAEELGTKVSSVEVEFSLASPDILHNGVAKACADFNIPIYAYRWAHLHIALVLLTCPISPIGRGLLSGKVKSTSDAKGLAKHSPRFQGGNLEENLKLVAEVENLAEKKECTPAQVAIAWVKHHSNWNGLPTIIPIPGASSVSRVEENLNASIKMSEEDMKHLNEAVEKVEIKGGRYPESHSKLNWG